MADRRRDSSDTASESREEHLKRPEESFINPIVAKPARPLSSRPFDRLFKQMRLSFAGFDSITGCSTACRVDY